MAFIEMLGIALEVEGGGGGRRWRKEEVEGVGG